MTVNSGLGPDSGPEPVTRSGRGAGGRGNPGKYLVIGPSWIGDMVMAQSLFRQLKSNNPRNEITVMAPAWTRPLLARMAEVSESLDSPFQHGELNLLSRLRIGRDLRRRGFTHAIVLPNSFKSALIPFFARIPERIGWRGEWRNPLLTDCRRLDQQKLPLMAQRYLALAHPDAGTPTPWDTHPPDSIDSMGHASHGTPTANPMGQQSKPDGTPTEISWGEISWDTHWPRPKLRVRPTELEQACSRLKLSRDAPVLALCPGAEYGPSKQWPAASHIELANEYLRRGWRVWLFGSDKDRGVATEIAAGIAPDLAAGCRDLTGRTSLSEAIDLLSAAAVVVSNDSGLMHIAAALDKPLAAIYGSSSPEFTPPLSEKVELLATSIECRPCYQRECPFGHLRCLTGIQPEAVAGAIDRLTNASPGEAANCGYS